MYILCKNVNGGLTSQSPASSAGDWDIKLTVKNLPFKKKWCARARAQKRSSVMKRCIHILNIIVESEREVFTLKCFENQKKRAPFFEAILICCCCCCSDENFEIGAKERMTRHFVENGEPFFFSAGASSSLQLLFQQYIEKRKTHSTYSQDGPLPVFIRFLNQRGGSRKTKIY